MKTKFFLLGALSLLLFNACNSNDEPEIKIAESPFNLILESCSEEESVFFYYQSLDPHCGFPKQYYITTSTKPSELVLQCKDPDNILIDFNQTKAYGDDYGYRDYPIHISEVVEISTTNDNKLIFSFPELQAENFPYFLIMRAFVVVTSETEDEKKSDTIFITRYLEY